MSVQKDDIFSVYPETLVIGPSLTAMISPLPYQSFAVIKYGGGGTLFLFAGSTMTFPYGTTPAGCSFATALRYPIGPNEVFNFNGCGYFKLAVNGATTTVFMARGLSSGSTQL